MNTFDSFILRTGFGKMIVSRMVTRFVKERFGNNVQVTLGDTTVVYKDGVMDIEINQLKIRAEGDEVTELLKL